MELFFYRYYFNLYTEWLPQSTRDLVDSLSNCEDILMNMLVSHVTGRPPIKGKLLGDLQPTLKDMWQ